MPKLIVWSRPKRWTSRRCRSRQTTTALASRISAPTPKSSLWTVLKFANIFACAAVNSSGSIMRVSSEERLRNKIPKITPIKIMRDKSRPPCRMSV